MIGDDVDYLSGMFQQLPCERKRVLPSEWASAHRYLPVGTSPKPGLWRSDVTPYAVEILDHFSPTSTAREIAVAKSVQCGFTVSVAENAIGWVIDVSPDAMMYVTADVKLAASRMTLAIDPMIDSSNLREKISPQANRRRKNAQTGDTSERKDFAGGYLIACGMNSPNSARSFPIKYLIMDEVDAGRDSLGDDGDPIALFKARTTSYEKSRKILYISTPLEESTSKIWKLYLQGDQRKFHVPCVHCGAFQVLEWGNLQFQQSEGMVVADSVQYQCPHCERYMKDYDKVEFLPRGEWRPTAKPSRDGLVSYQISGLYSPLGFKAWSSLAQDFIEAEAEEKVGNFEKMKSFYNLGLGEPWKTRGEEVKWQEIAARRGDGAYFRGIVPDEGPIFLTGGIDVHQSHLNVEIVAWGRNMESWSVGYYVLDGDVEDWQTWKQLTSLLRREWKTRKGNKLKLLCCLIDCGWGAYRDTVFEYCKRMRAVFPAKGQQVTVGWDEPFKKRDLKQQAITMFRINSHMLKSMLAEQLKRGLNENGSAPAGYCHWPQDAEDSFFRELTAERLRYTYKRGTNSVTKAEWVQVGTRDNHALDCRVNAMAAMYEVAYNISLLHLKQKHIIWERFWKIAEKHCRPE